MSDESLEGLHIDPLEVEVYGHVDGCKIGIVLLCRFKHLGNIIVEKFQVRAS